MVDELEALWSKLTFIEEEGEGIELGSDSMKAAREIGKNCLVMRYLRSVPLYWKLYKNT